MNTLRTFLQSSKSNEVNTSSLLFLEQLYHDHNIGQLTMCAYESVYVYDINKNSVLQSAEGLAGGVRLLFSAVCALQGASLG